MSESEVVEAFQGVYLLYCTNPKYKGRTYIGYTVDPNRRIKQHNRGVKSGGAYKTSNKGPWEMVLIVHGFPNEICALSFEWAWQHPGVSRRLQGVGRKKSREQNYEFCLRVLAHMLRTKPWCRLPLTLRWLKQQYMKDFPAGLEPPVHMPVAYGPVKPLKVAKSTLVPSEDEDIEEICSICDDTVKKSDVMRCLLPSCPLAAHIICLANVMLEGDVPGMVVPVEGRCPSCGLSVLWGDLVRLKRGCYQREEPTDDTDHWVDSLSQVSS